MQKVKCPQCQMAIVPNRINAHIKGDNCWGETPILDEETRAIWFYWKKKRGQAKNVGLPFTLSATDMLGLFTEAGISAADIGRGSHQHCLGRYGDTGGYEMGNCRFITAKENREEMTKSGSPPKALMADGIRYESTSVASRAMNVSRGGVQSRIKSKNYPEWYVV